MFKLGALVLLGGLLATIYFYGKLRKGSGPGPAPAFVRYFGVAILIGIAGYVAGTAIGIYFACSVPAAGDLCGLYGALGAGPLLAGVALFLYGLSWTWQSHAPASAGAPAPTTAGWHGWTEHPLVRAVVGLAGAGFALYGATALLDGEGRGAAAVVVGGAGLHWAFVGRLPSWFRR